MIEMTDVMMYTQSTCPWCKKAKKYFTKKGIPFDFIDYDIATDEQKAMIRKEMSERNVTLAFPYVRIGEKAVVGYDPDKYEEMLKE